MMKYNKLIKRKQVPAYYWIEIHPFYGQMTHLGHKKPTFLEGDSCIILLKFHTRKTTFVGWDNDRVWKGKFMVGDGAKSSKTGKSPKFLNRLGWRNTYFG